MRKIVLAFIGVALIAGSASPAAFAREHHRAHTARQYTYERFRNANAYARPYAVPNAATPGYSGGMGGWGSMTGFN